MRFREAVVLGCVLVTASARMGWSATGPVTIRPQQTTDVANVANAANTIDDNPGTFAAIALARVCRANHAEPQRATVTFDGFKTGYRPVRLEVAWNASAVFAVMADTTASVTGLVEYNTGNAWRKVETQSWTSSSKNCPGIPDGSLTCLNHTASAALPPGLDSARVRVRIGLTAGFSECEGSGISGVANVLAQAKIYDVRMIAEKVPVSSKSPVRKGVKRPAAKTP
jgi:hypothetical protein